MDHEIKIFGKNIMKNYNIWKKVKTKLYGNGSNVVVFSPNQLKYAVYLKCMLGYP